MRFSPGTSITGDYTFDGGEEVVEDSAVFGTQSKLEGCALAQSAVTFESEGTIDLNHYIANGPGNVQAGSARHLRGQKR
jgi:hypothetical protein